MLIYPEDLEMWEGLAHERKIRLPRSDAKYTLQGMRNFLHKLGFTATSWKRGSREDIKAFKKDNPDWTLKAWAGGVLEQLRVLEKV